MTKMTEIIQNIVELELEMFLSVSARERARCQENPDAFRFYRSTMFSTWSEATLQSYHEDLAQAKAQGENLMTIKYAKIEGLLAKRSENFLLDKIIEIEVNWAREMAEKFPNLHKRARPLEEDSPGSTSMRTYLRGELETYSDRTLGLYYAQISECLENQINLAEKKLLMMVKKSGYSSLEEAEAKHF